jgi:TolB-like protein/Tfp pilus assembly protein PilF
LERSRNLLLLGALVERRLAAILAADVVGYSRLMGADEAGTLATLRTLINDLVEPTLKRHHGRVVKLIGDGLLAEFASVVDAVTAAVEIQTAAPEWSANLTEDQRIALRIGVNIGDIVVEDGDLFGDGVNVAARLQEVADPNGVAISGDAYRQLSGRLDVPFEGIGEKALKNIKQPVPIWKWSAAKMPGNSPESSPPLTPPGKPSIAVLPFDNMSGDPEQEYFSDGLTEDLITALSKSEDLLVIARNSSFAFRGGNVDVQEIGKKLGARYVLEGSVRKSGNQVRINAQLIDAATRKHLWAERFDGTLENVFELQDMLTEQIAGQVLPKLERTETERANRLKPDQVNVYDLYLRAVHHYHAFSFDDILAALKILEKALAIDPNYPPALALSGICYARILVMSWDKPREQAHMKAGVFAARRAAELAPEDATVLWMSGLAIGRLSGDLQGGVDFLERAITLNSNSYQAHGAAGLLKAHTDDAAGAIDHLKQAIRLNPIDPRIFNVHANLANAYNHTKNYDEAKRHALMALQLNPRYEHSHREYVESCIGCGQIEDARAGARALISQFPNFSTASLLDRWERHHRPITPGRVEHLEALRKAGLPE